MADDSNAGPERSSFEVKSLLRKLDPEIPGGGHKERVRRLARFRNYVAKGAKNSTPEFYDDDLPLLLLGSQAPAAIVDDELVGQNLYGLLQACGSPSGEHANMLKRSARNAMLLLKYLVIDHVEYSDGTPLQNIQANPKELNGFAVALCSCTKERLRLLNLELHIAGDKRGGAREEASEVICLLVTRHLAEDGQTPEPLGLRELLPTKEARIAFDSWLTRNTPRDVQQAVKRAILAARQKEKKIASARKQQQQHLPQVLSAPTSEDDDRDADDADPVSAFKRKKRQPKPDEELPAATGRGSGEELNPFGSDSYGGADSPPRAHHLDGPPTCWEDSMVSRAQKARMSAAVKGDHILSLREEEEAMQEKEKHDEDKARLYARDPLGIRPDDFDLRTVQEKRVELLEQAVRDIEFEMRQEERQHDDKQRAQRLESLEAQKESLESILDGLTGIGGETKGQAQSSAKDASILPTDESFDPLLFLTLIHRNAGYQQLSGSIDDLGNKTDDQALQLQNLVRDNFDLFVRCSDGSSTDVFNEYQNKGPGVLERLEVLDAISESCSEQARRSFKPLLDNTNEVRKVQAAVAVLHRVAPILHTPSLMRQHLENGRFSQAIKAYNRVTVIDENCNIDLLNHVKDKAAQAAREARRELENRLAKDNVSVTSLLDGIRDLRELLELDIPEDPEEDAPMCVEDRDESKQDPKAKTQGVGVYDIDGYAINVRDHTPALACLLLQSCHFSSLVKKAIAQAADNTQRIFEGESLSMIAGGEAGMDHSSSELQPEAASAKSPEASKTSGNQWKYDVLDARVIATARAVELSRSWLPRLLRIGVAAHEDEKRRAARIGRRRSTDTSTDEMDNELTAFELVITHINPALTLIAEHATFCAVGSSNQNSGKEIKMSFGRNADEKLWALLRSPLPPSQSSKCAKELADLVEVIVSSSATANGLRPQDRDSSRSKYSRLSPLDECRVLAEEAVVTVERRRCIYAFDVCARTCSGKASGSGRFDGDTFFNCLQTLSEELTRPEECASEVEKGCELVVRRCCEGLASYVRDRGDSARLRAVAECADALSVIADVVREVGYLTNGRVEAVEEIMMEDILGLEGAMFDEFLDNTRHNVETCSSLGWLDLDEPSHSLSPERGGSEQTTFPPYLSASLLTIVRCRAQVERALGSKVRKSEANTYQFLAMATAADGVIEGICNEIQERKTRIKVRQADRLANELQFLMNTLKNYLSDDALAMVDTTRRIMCSKAGRGGGIQGDGPDGLAALEDLERLGRVYVLCLAE